MTVRVQERRLSEHPRRDIPRLAISAPEPSSGGANRQHWRLNPGVYETGASPTSTGSPLRTNCAAAS